MCKNLNYECPTALGVKDLKEVDRISSRELDSLISGPNFFCFCVAV
jgi:hypothetical protein